MDITALLVKMIVGMANTTSPLSSADFRIQWHTSVSTAGYLVDLRCSGEEHEDAGIGHSRWLTGTVAILRLLIV